MGPDHDIDFARADVVDNRFVLARVAKARDHFDAHRVALETVAHRVPMLLRQHRGRHQHRHLPSVHHRDKRRAQCHLGLAEAGVAANQPVHRLGPAHVAHNLVDRGELVGRLFEFEALGEFRVIGARMGEGVALHHLARGIDVEQIGSHREHRLLGAPLDPVP